MIVADDGIGVGKQFEPGFIGLFGFSVYGRFTNVNAGITTIWFQY